MGLTKAQKRAAKRKKRRAAKKANRDEFRAQEKRVTEEIEAAEQEKKTQLAELGKVEVVYTSSQIDDDVSDLAGHFADVFKEFRTPEELTNEGEVATDDQQQADTADTPKVEEKQEQESESEDDEEEETKELTAKEKKKLQRLTIAELKTAVSRPDIVELHDQNSPDPRLLVFLKSRRNAVPVPRHWKQKRKYLQNKRGIEKLPFELPKFIQDTGIVKIRDAQLAKNEDKSIKQRQRERMNPTMGKIEIDYQVLHDAFFKWQTRPPMTGHGDLYYENKEFEVKMNLRKPGNLSDELRKALNMGPNSPPPWLVNMQRFGPPPSYPDLKIPGLNAPIPPGAKYGYADDQWGKPPVDKFQRPLYGDPFGTGENMDQQEDDAAELPVAFLAPWGQVEDAESSDDESSEEEESDDEEMQVDEADGVSSTASGITSMSSHLSGLTTPDVVNVRKGTATPDVDLRKPSQPKQLFTVLQEKKSSAMSSSFGSAHVYEVPGQKSKKSRQGNVNVAINPDELASLDEATLKRKYEEQLQVEKAQKDTSYHGVTERNSKKRKKGSDAMRSYKF